MSRVLVLVLCCCLSWSCCSAREPPLDLGSYTGTQPSLEVNGNIVAYPNDDGGPVAIYDHDAPILFGSNSSNFTACSTCELCPSILPPATECGISWEEGELNPATCFHEKGLLSEDFVYQFSAQGFSHQACFGFVALDLNNTGNADDGAWLNTDRIKVMLKDNLWPVAVRTLSVDSCGTMLTYLGVCKDCHGKASDMPYPQVFMFQFVLRPTNRTEVGWEAVGLNILIDGELTVNLYEAEQAFGNTGLQDYSCPVLPKYDEPAPAFKYSQFLDALSGAHEFYAASNEDAEETAAAAPAPAAM